MDETGRTLSPEVTSVWKQWSLNQRQKVLFVYTTYSYYYYSSSLILVVAGRHHGIHQKNLQNTGWLWLFGLLVGRLPAGTAAAAAMAALAPLLHHLLDRRHNFGLRWTLRLILVGVGTKEVIASRLLFCNCGVIIIIIIIILTQVEKAVLHPYCPGQ